MGHSLALDGPLPPGRPDVLPVGRPRPPAAVHEGLRLGGHIVEEDAAGLGRAHPAGAQKPTSGGVVLGGLGSVTGSLVGAYVVGYLETITAYLISPSIRTIPVLLLLVVVVYLRPQGLLGRR